MGVNTVSLSLNKCDLYIQEYKFLDAIERNLKLKNKEIVPIGMYGP